MDKKQYTLKDIEGMNTTETISWLSDSEVEIVPGGSFSEDVLADFNGSVNLASVLHVDLDQKGHLKNMSMAVLRSLQLRGYIPDEVWSDLAREITEAVSEVEL